MLALATVSAMVAEAAPKLKSPGNLRTVSLTPFEIQLTWSDKSSNEDGFKIERARIGGKFEQIAQVLPGTTTYRHQNLFPGEFNFYRVRAFNTSGNSGYSSVAVGFTTRPTCPLFVNEWGRLPWDPLYGSVPAGLTNVVAIASSGESQHFALRRDGTVVGWGSYFDELKPPTGLRDVVAIAPGHRHVLALKKDGNIVGWGSNVYGQANPPPKLRGVVAIATGAGHSLCLRNDGTVIGWGYNEFGQATPPANLKGVVAIAASSMHSLALRSDGTVVSWGWDFEDRLRPPAGLSNVVAIATGYEYSLALKRDGTVTCWPSWFAEQMPADLTNVCTITAGGRLASALKRDGTVVSWPGNSSFGIAPPADLQGVVAISAADIGSLTLSTTPNIAKWLFATVTETNRISLSWPDYSSGLAGFQIQRAPYVDFSDQAVWKTIANVAAGVTNFNDKSLRTNGLYLYRVRAHTTCQASAFGDSARVKLGTPDKPSTPYGAAMVDQAAIWWYQNEQGTLKWNVERALDVGGIPGPWESIGNAFASEPYVGGYTDRGLIATSYWYRVQAANAFGTSPFSDPALVNITPPHAPYYLSGSVSGTNQVSLSWYATPPDQAGFKVERATDIEGLPGTWKQIGVVLTNDYFAGFIDRSVEKNAAYWYRVRAFNVLGDSPYSSSAYVSLFPPTAPELHAYAVGDRSQLSWSYTYAGVLDGAKVERANDANGEPGDWSEIAIIPANGPGFPGYAPYLDIGLTTDSVYWYRLRLYNWIGDSPYSQLVQVIVAPSTNAPPPVSDFNGNLPRIISMSLDGSNIVINWNSSAGSTNFIEATTTLKDPFSPVSPPLSLFGDADTGTFVDIGGATNAMRFYRIRRLP